MRRSFLSFCVVMAAATSQPALATAQGNTFSDVYRAYQHSLEESDTAASEALAKKALSLGRQKFGDDSENTANLLYTYGNALIANQKFVQAADVFKEVADRYDELYGDESPELFKFYADAILALQEAPFKQREQLRELRQRYLKKVIMDADDVVKNTQDPTVAAHLYYLGSRALVKEGYLPVYASTAKSFMEQAVAHMESALEPTDMRTLEVKFIQGAVLALNRDPDAAIAAYEEVVAAFDDNLDYSHPFALASHAKLVELYERENSSEKATQHCIAIGKMTPWEDDLEPTPLFRKNPEYPKFAARNGTDGSVKVEFTIDEQGFVRDIKVLDVKGGSGFKRKGVEAMKKWRYAPKFENGKAVPATGNVVQMDFKLS